MELHEHSLSVKAFKLTDPLFMKIGKFNARRIAKKDKSDDLLMKRKNQEALIIKTYRRGVNILSYFVNLKIPFLIALPFLASIAMKVNITSHNIYDIVFGVFSLTYLGIGIFSLSHKFGFDFRKASVEILLLQNIQYTLKDKEQRFIIFLKKRNYTFTLEILAQSIMMFMTVDSFSDKQTSYASSIFTLLLISQIIVYLSTFMEWFIQCSLIATVAHCDDFGETEQATKKETKDSLSYAQT